MLMRASLVTQESIQSHSLLLQVESWISQGIFDDAADFQRLESIVLKMPRSASFEAWKDMLSQKLLAAGYITEQSKICMVPLKSSGLRISKELEADDEARSDEIKYYKRYGKLSMSSFESAIKSPTFMQTMPSLTGAEHVVVYNCKPPIVQSALQLKTSYTQT